MTKTKVFIFTSVLAVILQGCASSGVQVSQEAALQFTEQKSTEAEILAKLGRPTMVTINGDIKVLMYAGSQVKVKAATFIPIVGALAGGSDVQSTAASYQLDAKTGILQKIIYSTYGTGVQTGSQPAPSTDTAPRYVQ